MNNRNCLLSAVASFIVANQGFANTDGYDFTELSLEELTRMDVFVTSAAKRELKLMDTPAAAYVITAEDIQRTGVTTIPDALRMVPGLQVGRISASEWGVTSRGFNGRYARYLLVLVDGKSAYDPLFSGVNWDELNDVLHDVERIEVIRGPGGTVWGSNAVNGVINIVTRKAGDADGGEAYAYAGNVEQFNVNVQYSGGTKSWDYLVSGTTQSTDGFESELGLEEGDWESSRFALYIENRDVAGELSFKLEAIEGSDEPFYPVIDPSDPAEVLQQDLFGQDKEGYSSQLVYRRPLNDSDSVRLRLAYDDVEREIDHYYNWSTQTFDLDLELVGEFGKHDYIIGFNSRLTDSELETLTDFTVDFARDSSELDTYAVFFQDIWSPNERLSLMVGGRFEDNSVAEDNYQGTLRAMWNISEKHRLWASWSRAKSSPSRVQTNESRVTVGAIPAEPPVTQVPTLVQVVGTGDVDDNTELKSIELGFRAELTESLNLDITAFKNRHDDLLTGELVSFKPVDETGDSQGDYFLIEAEFFATASEDSEGIELAMSWQINDNWLLGYSGSYINFDGDNSAALFLPSTAIITDLPESQHSLRLYGNLSDRLQLNLWYRYVDEIYYASIDDYQSLSINLSYDVTDDISVFSTLSNLMGGDHVELTRESFNLLDDDRYDIETSLVVGARIQF